MTHYADSHVDVKMIIIGWGDKVDWVSQALSGYAVFIIDTANCYLASVENITISSDIWHGTSFQMY